MSSKKKRFLPTLERLEDRTVPYALTGGKWSNLTVTASYLPDGTATEGYSSSLFSELNQVAPTAVWQTEFARALQTWANASNLNIYFVNDSGLASGTSGSAQGDSRFGDIRLGAHPLGAGYAGWAYAPSSGSTLGGDITLSPDFTYKIGTHLDLYSLLLHETGHALGLDHSTSGTVMYPSITGVYGGLTSDDIAGIQAMYGARQADSFDKAASNNTLTTASNLTLNSSGVSSNRVDLTSLADVDFYRVVAPTSANGSLTVTLDARQVSLLRGQVSVFDAAGNLLGSASAASYGQHAVVSLTGVTAGQTYFIKADGAADDTFGMGAYQLQVAFGVSGEPEPTPPPGLSPDRFESNNTLATARNLGRVSSTSQTGLTVHSSTDVDYYSFEARFTANYRIAALFTQASGNLDLVVYNASGQVVATGSSLGDNETLTVSLTAGQRYYVKVFSPTGATNSYDLSIEKVGGSSGGGKGGKGGKGGGALLEGHGTTVDGYGRVDLTGFAVHDTPALNVLSGLPTDVLQHLFGQGRKPR